MNSTEPTVPVQPRRIQKRYVFLAAIFVILGVGCLAIVSVFRFGSDMRALRETALKTIDGQCEQRIAIHVGGLATGVARFASGFFSLPPEARAALQSVRSAEVGVYETANHSSPAVRAQLLNAADETMQKRGWTRIVGVIDRKDLVAIYVPAESFTAQRVKCCVLVLDERNLVIASVRGNVDPLIELARTRIDFGKAQQRSRDLIGFTVAD